MSTKPPIVLTHLDNAFLRRSTWFNWFRNWPSYSASYHWYRRSIWAYSDAFKRQLGQYTYAYNRRCRSGGHKALYEFLIEISVINAYKLSLHSEVSKEAKYTVHSEFRTPKRRRILREITPNLGGNKRGKRTTFGCDTCDIPICKDGPCWAAYHNSINKMGSEW